MVSHIFDEYQGRLHFSDDSGDVGPEVPFVFGAAPFPSGAERLAGVRCDNAIDEATERESVEGFNIRPTMRRSQASFFARAHQSRDCIGFSFHVHPRSSAWNCQSDGKISRSGS